MPSVTCSHNPVQVLQTGDLKNMDELPEEQARLCIIISPYIIISGIVFPRS